jgi:hypothetical protein
LRKSEVIPVVLTGSSFRMWWYQRLSYIENLIVPLRYRR